MSNVSPILLREEIARRLRAARKAAGIGTQAAADQLDLDRTVLCRIELGKRGIDVHLVRTMMDLYDFRDDDILDMVREARKPGWWKGFEIADDDFIALEAGASTESSFEVQVVPGLLQTADYARALFESGKARYAIAKWLKVRLIRQDRLTADELPINLIAIISENALRRPVGGSEVMRAQLRHLALVAELPTVSLHLLPTTVVSNDATYGGFALLDFLFHDQPSVAYAAHALGAERTADREVVRATRLRFERLQSAALDADQSVALIERVYDELWSG